MEKLNEYFVLSAKAQNNKICLNILGTTNDYNQISNSGSLCDLTEQNISTAIELYNFLKSEYSDIEYDYWNDDNEEIAENQTFSFENNNTPISVLDLIPESDDIYSYDLEFELQVWKDNQLYVLK